MKHVAFSRIGRAAFAAAALCVATAPSPSSAALVTKTIYARRHDGMKC